VAGQEGGTGAVDVADGDGVGGRTVRRFDEQRLDRLEEPGEPGAAQDADHAAEVDEPESVLVVALFVVSDFGLSPEPLSDVLESDVLESDVLESDVAPSDDELDELDLDADPARLSVL
jgi:hypothetical protein